MRLTYLLILTLISNFSFAQISGKVDWKELGISFTIPDGWVGQEIEGGILMATNTLEGIMIVTTNDVTSMEEMGQEARYGIIEDGGTNLQLVSSLDKLSSNILGGLYSGTLEWNPAKAYVIGVINPQGQSVSILAMSSPEAYSDQHAKYCKELGLSVKFYKPVVPELTEDAKEWATILKNARLTYMSSYDSGGGSGYMNKEEIDLCAQGYFNFYSNYSMSIDTGGGFGSDNNSEDGAGTWKVITNAQSESVLQLNYYSGEVSEYVITYYDETTYLDGYRYFRTYGGDYDDGPDCN